MEILAEATRLEARGENICHLEVGEPGQAPAPAVIEVVKKALPDPQKYTNAKGMIKLRELLAVFYQARYSVAVDPDNIIVTMGSSSGFIIAFLSGFEKGATIAVTRPGYPAYLNILDGLGFGVTEIPLDEKNNWRLCADDIEAAYNRKPFAGLLFASPANPTGAAVSREEFEKIVQTCARLNVRLISDEIYHGLEYEMPATCALEFSNDAIVVNSFSKYYCMTGWRVGWLILPDDLIRRAEMLQQNLFISAPSLSQIAAIAALGEQDYSKVQRVQYKKNRDILTAGLKELGFASLQPADGAFYSYVDVSPFTNDSLEFCQTMLRQTGVAATPGADFDRVNGHRYVRFSYAGRQDKIELALKKMAGFLARP